MKTTHTLFLSFLFAGVASCAMAAAKSRADQKTDIDTLFASNNSGSITAAKLREGLKTVIDSAYNEIDDGTTVDATALAGYFGDPSTNSGFVASMWRTKLSLVAIATSGNASDLSSGTVPDARFPATLPVLSGANLTALNASNLGSGTLPDARFPATLPASSGINLTALNATNLGSGTVPDARFPATLPASSAVNLTALNATNLASGTVPDARFPATLPALSGVNLTALNATNLGSGTVPDARFPATLPAISGANLTALNADNLAAGTLPDARFPAALPASSGANLTALNASNLGSGTIPDARFPATLPASSGLNLTALNASNLGSGTVPDARFPATLPAASGVNLTALNASNLASGTVPAARGGAGTVSGLLKGNGAGVVSAASSSTDYVPPGAITSGALTMATARVLGRTTASSGAIEEISAGSSLSLSAGSIDAVQDIRTTASPTFATPVVTSLALGATTPGTISGSSGDVTITGAGTNKTISMVNTGSGGFKMSGTTRGLVIVADSNTGNHLTFRNSSAPSTDVWINYQNSAALNWYNGGDKITLRTTSFDLNLPLNLQGTSQVTGVRTAVATLDFPSIAANGGTQDLTVTVTGAAVGMATNVVENQAASVEAGVTLKGWVSATNTVTVRATNSTTGAIDPASASFRATVTSF